MKTSYDSLLQRILKKQKKGLATSFQLKLFAKFYNEDFSFVILYKLAKVHYQAVIAYYVTQ